MSFKSLTMIVCLLVNQNLGAKTCSKDSPFNTIQVKGSHNSYHIKPFFPISFGWNYSHPPLQEQFEMHGIRQIELDIYWNQKSGEINVLHMPIVDTKSTCGTIGLCFEQIQMWSVLDSDHPPIMVLLEIKDSIYDQNKALHYLNIIEQKISDHFKPESIFAPDDLKGQYQHLRDAATNQAWPSYKAMAGKFIFVLHTQGLLRTVYTRNHCNLDGRLMFAESDGTTPYSAIIIKNQPIHQFTEIKNLVKKGFIVRTKADSGLVHSPLRIEKAIDSGAQYITTDFLLSSERGYFRLSDGSNLKCNF